jgi:hypothetical protein
MKKNFSKKVSKNDTNTQKVDMKKFKAWVEAFYANANTAIDSRGRVTVSSIMKTFSIYSPKLVENPWTIATGIKEINFLVSNPFEVLMFNNVRDAFVDRNKMCFSFRFADQEGAIK